MFTISSFPISAFFSCYIAYNKVAIYINRRGLSSFYQGKSQSFTSLSSVEGIEDLPKKQIPYRNYKSYTLPKAIISKKVSRGRRGSSLSFPCGRSNVFNSTRPPLSPQIQKKV